MIVSSPRPAKRTARRRLAPRSVATYVALVLASVVMMYPLLWMLASSFKPSGEIFGDVSFLPSRWILDHYIDGWSSFGFTFGQYFLNSLVVAVGAIVGNLVSCALAAYAFARLEFRFKRLWMALMLGSIMLPYHVTVLPQYIIFQELGWLNTFWPLIVPKFLATDAFFIFLMVQFIRGLPTSLDEAALIDGCNRLQIFLRVILPLISPALATTAIFTFIWTWNDFFTPLIYLTDPSKYTVPLGLNAFLDSTGESAWGSLFAMAVLSLGPVLGFFIAAQKYLVRGIATTGLK